MTAHKHLKQRVRARMQKTGESYASARRHVVGEASSPATDSAARWHFPGNIPATTALRILLAHAGVRAPHTGQPFSEAMLFGIAGGIGIGVFSFFYEKEDTASFFVAGRHSWQDHQAYLGNACRRLGVAPVVRESGGARAADKQLRDLLASHGPCIAWVDMAHLPHRALPGLWSGGGYHLITVYRVNDEDGTALIGDLTDEPIPIPLADLALARGRIKKDKNRLLGLPAAASPHDLAVLVREGLRACQQGLGGAGGPKNYKTNFSLDALQVWGQRMYGSKDKENWERVFAIGPRFWNGLVSVYSFIEHYGTGGGLCRPLFADFLNEAADALDDNRLRGLAERYADLGRGWSELARAALPDDVPAFREARDLHDRKAELTAAGGSPEEIRGLWDRLGELQRQTGEHFPLSAAACDELRANLQARIRALHDAEVAARTALGAAVA
jgi:hypothetical protein